MVFILRQGVHIILKSTLSIVLLVSLFHNSTVSAQSKSDWVLKKEGDGVNIYRRYLDSLKVYEYKGEFEVKSSLERILKFLKDDESNLSCLNRALKFRAFEIDETQQSWKTYTLIDIPWPFNDKELVTKNNLYFTPSLALISMTSVDKIEGNENRITGVKGEWRIEKSTGSDWTISYQVYTSQKGVLPEWFLSPFIVSQYHEFLKCISSLM
ncbi:hypothetical protein BC781_10596 [Sediminitomix flava]|uniref:START domain-containing protein n=2 Tax=Sediminitomix flava TaxID=379075 RepID=A0A315Z6N8_SEDFL|nr:hypothetical protein BC781_10596 [Sediminitomix flava]